jgi:hypothetical protein
MLAEVAKVGELEPCRLGEVPSEVRPPVAEADNADPDGIDALVRKERLCAVGTH